MSVAILTGKLRIILSIELQNDHFDTEVRMELNSFEEIELEKKLILIICITNI